MNFAIGDKVTWTKDPKHTYTVVGVYLYNLRIQHDNHMVQVAIKAHCTKI